MKQVIFLSLSSIRLQRYKNTLNTTSIYKKNAGRHLDGQCFFKDGTLFFANNLTNYYQLLN